MHIYKGRENQYDKDRYYKLKQKALDYLGNSCVGCGANENLQFDHIDPTTKRYVITTILKHSNDKLYAELDKCQLLCRPCHDIKSIRDLDKKPAKGSHGTLSSYRYCKCNLCRAAKATYTRSYRATHPRNCKMAAKNSLTS